MRPRITPTAQPTTRERIAGVEAALGKKLPAAYVELLLAANGGDPSPETYVAGDRTSSVDTFFAVDAPKPHHDLVEVATTLAELLPPRMLPIAHDFDGNVILISCDAPDEGSIHIFHDESETIAPLAPSLGAWLDSFTPIAGGAPHGSAGWGGGAGQAPPIVGAKDLDTVGPLALALRAGNLDLADRLIDGGESLRGALTAAAAMGQHEMVKKLLDRGADPDEIVDPRLGSPIQVASRNGHVAVVQTLLQRGAKPIR